MAHAMHGAHASSVIGTSPGCTCETMVGFSRWCRMAPAICADISICEASVTAHRLVQMAGEAEKRTVR